MSSNAFAFIKCAFVFAAVLDASMMPMPIRALRLSLSSMTPSRASPEYGDRLSSRGYGDVAW